MQHGLNLTTVVCEDCSFVFTNPLPPRETYERFYEEAYADFYGHITPVPEGSRLKSEPVWLSSKFSRLEQTKPLAGSRLLEIGPGPGLFLWWARERGCEVLGVEPSPEFCRVLEQTGLPHLQGTLDEVDPAIHGTFDLIYMSHVFEHFYDPNEALMQCRGLLAEGGLLAIEVPNVLKPFRSLDHYFLRYVHPSNFSPRTLQSQLEKQGFRPFHVDAGGSDWRSPQNLFVIAAKQTEIPGERPPVPAETEEVMHALREYRQRWQRSLALKWHARSLSLRIKRSLIKAGRPLKRLLKGRRAAATAQHPV
jgi:SAM-dependent methyltransferase